MWLVGSGLVWCKWVGGCSGLFVGDEVKNDRPRRHSFISKLRGSWPSHVTLSGPNTRQQFSHVVLTSGVYHSDAPESKAHHRPSHSLPPNFVFIPPLTKHFITQCLAAVKVEKYVGIVSPFNSTVADSILRVSERVVQSVTARSFVTTSRALPSPPSVVSLVEVASSVSLV